MNGVTVSSSPTRRTRYTHHRPRPRPSGRSRGGGASRVSGVVGTAGAAGLTSRAIVVSSRLRPQQPELQHGQHDDGDEQDVASGGREAVLTEAELVEREER